MFNAATMSITGIRFPEALEKAVDDVVNEESVDKSTAVRMLVDIGYKEWRLKKALQKLREGKVSLWKASEIAGISLWDLLLVVKREGTEWVEYEAEEFPWSTH